MSRPRCSTCHDTHVVRRYRSMGYDQPLASDTVPCPDCTDTRPYKAPDEPQPTFPITPPKEKQ